LHHSQIMRIAPRPKGSTQKRMKQLYWAVWYNHQNELKQSRIF
jgi:hypothetical protein